MKGSETMIKELNQVVDYIEENLLEDLPLEKISDFAGVSDFHFRKIFFYLSGMTLSEYIKSRRLSEANKELMAGESVTDVAFKYGFDSLDGFTRSFKKFSGYLPSEIAKLKTCKVVQKLSFAITVKGGNSMEFRIEEKSAFKFAGVSKRVPLQFEGVNNAIVELAQSITQDQREELHRLKNIEPTEVVNMSHESDSNFTKDGSEITHLIGVLTTKDDIGVGLDVIEVPAATWAVFPNEGPFPETLQNTYAEMASVWLPSSDYELIDLPNFSFTKMNQPKEGYAYSEVWVAVKKK
jgi:AraC family transcriptional regulator